MPVSTEDLTKYNILIVDDEKTVLSQLEQILKLNGFRVAAALSGDEGLEILKTFPAKLVISDQVMPKMSGTEFLTKVKERHPAIVTMILSGFSEKEYIMDALNKAGAYQYLLKPWNADELIHRVTQALQFYHLQAERRRLAEANQRLLKKMSLLENFSLVGDFSEAFYARFFPLMRMLIKEGSLRPESTLIGGSNNYLILASIISKLGKLGMLKTLDEQKNFQFSKKNVTPILRDCVSEARKLADGVEFIEEYDKDLPEILVHPGLFDVAIKALIENAVIFNNGSKKKVIVRARRIQDGPEDFVMLEVEDNGPGIRKEMKGKIFSPLASTHPQEAGEARIEDLGDYNFGYYYHVGLGLPIARWCVTHHDGILDFRGEEGKGSTFFIQIPTEQTDLKQQQGLV